MAHYIPASLPPRNFYDCFLLTFGDSGILKGRYMTGWSGSELRLQHGALQLWSK